MDWQTDSTKCSRNSCGKENTNIETNLSSLLDELLRKDGINREEYTQLDNVLAESLGSGIDEEEAEEDKTEDETCEGKLKKLIQSTVEYSIQHDKKELLELIKEFRKDVGEDLLDIVLELEELVDVHLLQEFLEKEPKRKMVLLYSNLIHILLKDINQNPHCAQKILTRMADADGEEALSFTLK